MLHAILLTPSSVMNVLWFIVVMLCVFFSLFSSPMDLADNSYSIAASLPRLFGALPLVHRMSSQQTTAITPGASISPDLWSEDMHRNVYDMYQPVERVKGTFSAK